jgi:PAS domain S-box-containing protein
MVNVIALMSQHNQSCPVDGEQLGSYLSLKAVQQVKGSCVLVIEGSKLVGSIAAKDILRSSARGINLDGVKAAEVMNRQAICLKQSQIRDIFSVASTFREHRISYLPVLDDDDHLVGLITTYSLRQLLQPADLLRWRTVAEVMTTSVVTATPTTSVSEVVGLMAEFGVSCAVIVEERSDPRNPVFSEQQRRPRNPVFSKNRVSEIPKVSEMPKNQLRTFKQYPIGIITEGDVLQFQILGLDFSTLTAETAMSAPLFPLSPLDSLWTACQQMEKLRIGRLVVCSSEGELRGIVTQSNLLRALDPVEMYQIVRSLEREVCKLEAEKLTILENRNFELEKQVCDRTAEIQERLESDRLLATIADRIRRSLDLEVILTTTVSLVREYLQSDRVLIYRFNPDWSGVVVAESAGENWDSLLGKVIRDPCFYPDWVEAYTKGRIRAVSDIYSEPNISPCHLELLKEWQLRAKLIVPVVRGDKLWGLMTAHFCGETHQWSKSEVQLVEQLVGHLGIAIQQAELYRQKQTELLERQKIEEILRNITAGVSSQTGEAFFQSLTQYLARALEVEYAVVAKLVGFERAAALAFCVDGKIISNFEHPLKNTPCEKVLSQGTCVYYRNVRQDFPEDILLQQWEIESYLGVSLLDCNDRPIGIIAVLSCKPLPETNLAEEVIKIFAVRAVAELERIQAETARRQQLERERLIADVALTIRRSLDLGEILDATVIEVRQILDCDRVLVYQFAPNLDGTIVAESVGGRWRSTLGANVKDTCFKTGAWEKYVWGGKEATPDIYNAGLSDCYINLLERYQVKANLVVPIVLEADRKENSPFLWGLLIAHQCSGPRQWQPEQLELLDELGVQLSIAIVQSQLYQQARAELAERQRFEAALQQANDELETKVAERTRELSRANQQLQAEIAERQQAEEALVRENMKSQLFSEIALKIRQSLQIDEILQTTVNEVQKILASDRVLIYQVFANGTGRTIAESVTPEWSSILDIPFPEEVFPLEYQQLYAGGKVKAIADVEREYSLMTSCLLEFLKRLSVKAKLVVPVIQQKTLWGFIIAHQCSGARQWNDFEIDLLQQLAIQVGIALSQAQFLSALRDSEERYRNMIETASEGIWIIDNDNYTTFVNDKMAQMLGYTSQEMLGMPLWEFMNEEEKAKARNNVDRRRRGIAEKHDFKLRRRDGSDLWTLISTTPLLDDCDNYLGALAMVSDISDRLKAEAKIQASLKEKEVLLKEIHHRVKNNLYVISNLLDLQSDTVDDEGVQNLFADSQNRIQTMALIHEQLYQSDNLAQINLADYINNLVNNLLSSLDTSFCLIQTVVNAEPIHLDLETAIPCGLLINELVTNSFKYAFPNSLEGEIKIELHSIEDRRYQLIISDNGIGIPERIDWQDSPSLGLRLVNILAEQLEATIELDRSNGTCFTLSFSELKYQERF